MNAPARPEMKVEPGPNDWQDHCALNITGALIDLYEAAFGNGDRNHKMDQAHAAPEILADAIHELLDSRRRLQTCTCGAGWQPAESEPRPSASGQPSVPESLNPSIPASLAFPDLVAAELDRARQLFPAELCSAHEAHGIIREQLDSFWDLIRFKHRPADRLLHELVQTAAMCQRAAEDLALLRSEPRPSASGQPSVPQSLNPSIPAEGT